MIVNTWQVVMVFMIGLDDLCMVGLNVVTIMIIIFTIFTMMRIHGGISLWSDPSLVGYLVDGISVCTALYCSKMYSSKVHLSKVYFLKMYVLECICQNCIF